MKALFISLFLLLSFEITRAQIRLTLNYNKKWEITTKDQGVYVRVCVYDTTSGFFAGPVADLYRSGKPQMTGNYKQRKKDGLFTFYYENGVVESTGNFYGDYRTGTWKYNYSNGTPKMELEFAPALGDEAKVIFLNDSTGNPLLQNGNGKWIEHIIYSDGAIAIITGEYKNFERTGKWTFDESRDIAGRIEEFENGKFQRGFITENGRKTTRVFNALDYGIYLPDKFFLTENFFAQLGVNFDAYRGLKLMRNKQVLVHDGITETVIDVLMPSKSTLTYLKGDTIHMADKERVKASGDLPAMAPGGPEAFLKFVSENMKYPSEARKKKQQGTVLIEFVVEADGTITNIAILKGIGKECDNEALRVFKKYIQTVKWSPAIEEGKPVMQRTVQSIRFVIG